MITFKLFGGMLFLSMAMHIFCKATTLNNEQKDRLAEFRIMVEKLEMPNDYMKDDAYLIRYLAAKDFNVKEAFDRLHYIMTIRHTKNINSILEENWSEYDKRFPYSTSSVNKEGRPILYYPFGEWDIPEIPSFNVQQFVRFAGFKIMEEMDLKVHSMRKVNKDISQFDVIVDFDGCSSKRDGCLHSILDCSEIMEAIETPFAEAIKKIYYINIVPPYRRLTKILSSLEMRKKVIVLGNREAYEPILLQDIEMQEFPNNLKQEKWSWTRLFGWC